VGGSGQRPIVLIVEPHLEGAAGHPIRYVRSLAQALASGGARVEVLANRRFPRNVSVGAPVKRVFERPIWLTWRRRPRWLEELGARAGRARNQMFEIRSTIVGVVDGLERPPGWRLLSAGARRFLPGPVRIGRRVLRLAILAGLAIVLGPPYVAVAALTVLFWAWCHLFIPVALRSQLPACDWARREGRPCKHRCPDRNSRHPDRVAGAACRARWPAPVPAPDLSRRA
jgi:hypothetical protein